MELRYLRYFSTVAELRSFTRAAQALHVAQPAISQQIRTLEAELGVTLLARTNRSVSLTAAGHAFLREARDILERVDRSRDVARRAAQGETGTLSIGCFGAASSLFLPKLVQAYRARFPLVRTRLYELTPGQQLEAFQRGQIDVGFTRPLPPSHAGGFVQKHVYRDRPVALLPDGHPLAGAAALGLERLADEDWVLFKRSEAPALFDSTVVLCEAAGFSPRVVAEPAMMLTLLMMVAAGVGVSVVPSCIRNLGQPGVRFLALSGGGPPLDLVAVRESGEPSPTIAAFFSHLAAHLPSIQALYEADVTRDDQAGTMAAMNT